MYYRNLFQVGIQFLNIFDGYGDMANYVTVEDAETYLLANKLDTSAWDDNETKQPTALTIATKIIDRLNFIGAMTEDDQDNQFPRDGDTEVPQDIKDACCEIAYSLLDGVDIDKERMKLGITSEDYASVRISYDTAVVRPHILAGVPSSVAWDLLKPYLLDPMYLTFTREN